MKRVAGQSVSVQRPVLCAVDASEHGAEVARTGARLALLAEAPLIFLHVYRRTGQRQMFDRALHPDRQASDREAGEVLLSHRAAELLVAPTLELSGGDPTNEILDAADDIDPALIILGTRAGGALGALRGGSVARQVTAMPGSAPDDESRRGAPRSSAGRTRRVAVHAGICAEGGSSRQTTKTRPTAISFSFVDRTEPTHRLGGSGISRRHHQASRTPNGVSPPSMWRPRRSVLAALSHPTEHPFRRADLGRRATPFLVGLGLGFVSLLMVEVTEPVFAVLAVALTFVTAIGVWAVNWESLPRGVAVLPVLAIVATVSMLREATGGVLDPLDFEALLMLPMLWVALYGSRTELIFVIATVTATFVVSMLLAEARNEEPSWLKAFFWPSVAAIVGSHVQALVGHVAALSRTDHLTQLPNRAAWDEHLREEVARSVRLGHDLVVALIDLDQFKHYNDIHGHAAGDELLRNAAKSWRSRLREVDFIARYGGEEFGVALPGSDLRQAFTVLDALRVATPIGETCSIGAAKLERGETPADVLARADAALYDAKAAGRDRVVSSVSSQRGAPSRLSPSDPARRQSDLPTP